MGGSAGLDAGTGAEDAGSDAGANSDAAPGDAGPESGPFPPVTDLAAEGPFAAAIIDGCGPSALYTCYHPQELAKDGVKHPFVTWGNGATTIPQMYTLLPHLASHGFVVIAANSPSVTPQDLSGGIDWLFAENERSGSVFYQKLDTSNVASMGYSLGSVGTFGIAADERLTTTVHISGGAFDRQAVGNLRNPAAFFCGTDADIAHANCDADFEGATVPVFYGVFDGDHLGILLPPYADQIREAVTGWLRWRLMADSTLKSMFVGSDCTLCTDPAWVVQQKGLS